jgi:hypothetical protein
MAMLDRGNGNLRIRYDLETRKITGSRGHSCLVDNETVSLPRHRPVALLLDMQGICSTHDNLSVLLSGIATSTR